MELHGFFEPILYSTYIRPLMRLSVAVAEYESEGLRLRLAEWEFCG